MEQWWNDTDRENRVWSNGGMILTGENRVWSNGGMILTGENRVWSNGGMILRGEIWGTGENLPQSHLVRHKSHIHWLQMEPSLQVTNGASRKPLQQPLTKFPILKWLYGETIWLKIWIVSKRSVKPSFFFFNFNTISEKKKVHLWSSIYLCLKTHDFRNCQTRFSANKS
jgi:hypothetical protein